MKEYESLKQKFHLPGFKDLNHEFELSVIEPDEFLLREILKKIEARHEYLASIIEEVLQPSPDSMQQMHEMKHFSQEQKEAVYTVYKAIQHYLRACVEAHLKRSDQLYAKLITEMSHTWPQLKEQSLSTITTMKESWKVTEDLQPHVEYFG